MTEAVSNEVSPDEAPLIEIKGLRTHFFVEGTTVRAVDGVDLHVARGECLGIVGESGSGKSVTQISVMGLIPNPPGKVVGGEIIFEGQDLLKLSKEQLRQIRGNRISMIWQDPMSSLNPFLRVSEQLIEPLQIHKSMSKEAAREAAIAMLQKVGIPAARDRFDQYPHQFSGGMRQRVMIAMALLCEPELLIADEPTTALDVTIQAQILELIKALRKDFGTSVVLITHDLGVVAGMAERIVVMYAGRVVEEAPAKRLFYQPAHPYTVGLLRSVPRLDRGHSARLIPIPGQPPDVSKDIPGCAFAPRCPWAQKQCRESAPPAIEFDAPNGGHHRAHCFRAQEIFDAELGSRASAEHVEQAEQQAAAESEAADD